MNTYGGLPPIQERLKARRKAEKKLTLLRVATIPIRLAIKCRIILLIALVAVGAKEGYKYFQDNTQETKEPYDVVDIIPNGQQNLTRMQIEEFLKELRNTKGLILPKLANNTDPEEARVKTVNAVLNLIGKDDDDVASIDFAGDKPEIDEIVETTLAQDDGKHGYGRELFIASRLTLDAVNSIERNLAIESDAKAINEEE